MLKPDYILMMPEEIQLLFQSLENEIIEDIARRISIDLKLTATADYQISQLKDFGYTMEEIEKKIAQTTNLSKKSVSELLKESTYLAHENDQIYYKAGGKELPEMSKMMEHILKATIVSANKDIQNITRTLGIATKGYYADLTEFYRDTLNLATLQVKSGAFTYNQAIQMAVKSLADSGIRSIDYESGYSSHIDVAVRRSILSSSRHITGIISEANADMMDQDLMEISSHMGARPSHADWQGEIVSRSGNDGNYLTLGDIGYGDITGFKGVNCRHDWYPYFKGISEKMKREPEPEPFEYNGREYDSYKASQYQRRIERNMRATKREIASYKGADLKNELQASRIKLRRQSDLYKDFSKKANLRTQFERSKIYVGNYGKISV